MCKKWGIIIELKTFARSENPIKQIVQALDKALMSKVKEECIAETKIDPKIITEMLSKKSWIDGDKTDCFLKCIMEKLGLLDSEAKVKSNFKETMKNLVGRIGVRDDDFLDSVLIKCKDLSGKNACDSALKKVKCFFKEAQEDEKRNLSYAM